MSSPWSGNSGSCNPNSIWNSNSPNLNLLRRFSLRASSTTDTPLTPLTTNSSSSSSNNNNNSTSNNNNNSSFFSNTTNNNNSSTPSTPRSIGVISNNNNESSLSIRSTAKSTCSWLSSADNKYLIGYIVICRQDLEIYQATQLGFQLLGGQPTQDGHLGAIVEHVVPGGLMNIVCKLKVGDEIVEWNGFNLRDKRNEEVVEIIESVKNPNSLRLVAVRQQPAAGNCNNNNSPDANNNNISSSSNNNNNNNNGVGGCCSVNGCGTKSAGGSLNTSTCSSSGGGAGNTSNNNNNNYNGSSNNNTNNVSISSNNNNNNNNNKTSNLANN